MKELTRSKLPLWEKRMGDFHSLSSEVRKKGVVYSRYDREIIFCQKDEGVYGRTSIGYVLNKELIARDWLKKKTKMLVLNGWQGHRVGSVPLVHKYKNDIKPRKTKGFLKELKNNISCEESYKSFYKLVRKSRKGIVVKCNDSCELDHENVHGNAQRGWKRSKKRKQWM